MTDDEILQNYANKWVNSSIKNPKGRQWIKDMMRLKKAGIKK